MASGATNAPAPPPTWNSERARARNAPASAESSDCARAFSA